MKLYTTVRGWLHLAIASWRNRILEDMSKTFDELAWVFDPDDPEGNVEKIVSDLIVVPVMGLTSQVRLMMEDFKDAGDESVDVWSSPDRVPSWRNGVDHRLLQHCRETGHQVAARLSQIVEHAEQVRVLVVPIPGVAVFYPDLLTAFEAPIHSMELSVKVVPVLATTRLPSDRQACRGVKFHLGRPTTAERKASVLGILDILENGILPTGGTNYLEGLAADGNPVFEQYTEHTEGAPHETAFT